MSDIERNDEQLRLIRLPEVKKLTGLSRPSIYRSMSAGKFPRATRFGRHTMWAAHEVGDWIRARLADREGAAAT